MLRLHPLTLGHGLGATRETIGILVVPPVELGEDGADVAVARSSSKPSEIPVASAPYCSQAPNRRAMSPIAAAYRIFNMIVPLSVRRT
jgi:hypothetical protein